MTSRRASALAEKAVARAIEGGQHQIIIDADGCTRILPLGVTPVQADDAALDAEIQGLITGHGHAAH